MLRQCCKKIWQKKYLYKLNRDLKSLSNCLHFGLWRNSRGFGVEFKLNTLALWKYFYGSQYLEYFRIKKFPSGLMMAYGVACGLLLVLCTIDRNFNYGQFFCTENGLNWAHSIFCASPSNLEKITKFMKFTSF